MLRSLLVPIIALALCAGASPADAAPLRYTIAGTGSLELASTAFNEVDFTIVMTGDPTLLELGALPLSSAKLVIEGQIETVFLNPTRLGLFSNTTLNIIYFGRNEALAREDMFDFFLSEPVDLSQPFGPVTGTGVFGLNQFVNVASSLGALTFVSSSDVQFAATVVPLPVPMLLFGSGLGLLAIRSRR